MFRDLTYLMACFWTNIYAEIATGMRFISGHRGDCTAETFHFTYNYTTMVVYLSEYVLRVTQIVLVATCNPKLYGNAICFCVCFWTNSTQKLSCEYETNRGLKDMYDIVKIALLK